MSVDEVTKRFSDMLDRIAIGEEVVITDKGEPIAKLVPISGDAEETREV